MIYFIFFLISSYSAPLPFEQLDKPIFLKNYCSEIQIIESKTLSKNEIDKISELCEKVIREIDVYLEKNNLHIFILDRKISISFLNSDGWRSLNDFDYRFAERKKYGRVLGFFSRAENWIVMRPPSDHRFNEIFAHELFHALIWNNGAELEIEGSFAEKDEELALGFTKFLKL